MSVFLEIPKDQWLYDNNHFFVIKDKYPVNEGHLLIISKDGTKEQYFNLNKTEANALTDTITWCGNYITKMYKPDGINIGMNCGKYAGQTVMHFHCHVIPRYNGDMENPAGGIRHCVKDKGYYKTE